MVSQFHLAYPYYMLNIADVLSEKPALYNI